MPPPESFGVRDTVNDAGRVRHIRDDATIAPHWEHTTIYSSGYGLQMTWEWT